MAKKTTTLNTSNTSWDLSFLGKNDKDPAFKKDTAALKKAYAAFAKKWEPRSDYLKQPRILKQALDEYEKLVSMDAGKEGLYFWMRSQLDSLNPIVKARGAQITELFTKLGNDIQFFEMRIAKIPIATQKKMLAHKELADYLFFLQTLFAQARHQLSEPEERIMNLKAQGSYINWKKMLDEFLSSEEHEVLGENGKKKKLTFEEILSLTHSKKKKVRDQAALAVNTILNKNLNVAEHEFNAILLNKKINDELRGFKRPDESRYLQDSISSKTVDVLASSVTNDFKTSKEYYKLKTSLFGLPKLAYHDRNAPYGDSEKKYTYKQSVALVYKVFDSVDSEFGNFFKTIIETGRTDVFPKKGRRGGAFCVYLKNLPAHIFLNHTNTLNDVRTLAHECGHAINGEIMKKRENALNYGGSMATAEVASTFMEGFVFDELIAQADDNTKLALMMQKLNDEVSSAHRQIAGHNFQLEVHKAFREQGYLSHEAIGTIFTKHMKAYMGPAVSQDKGSENWWVYWSHFRRYFYNFQYADGLLVAKYLQRRLKADSSYITEIKEFLSIGSSKSFEDTFKSIGADVTKKAFWEEGLKETQDLLKETKKLAKKLGKI